MTHRFIAPAVALSAAMLVAPAAVRAQTDPNEEDYRRAAQVRTTEPEAALAAYQALYARTSAPRALAQVGFVEGGMGRWLLAEAHLSAALGFAADPWIASRRPALEATLREIRTHLTDLMVVANVAGASLRVNGVAAGTLPLARAVRVVVGQVVIDLEAAGYEPVRQTVQATPGRTQLALALVPVASTRPLATAAPLATASAAPVALAPPVPSFARAREPGRAGASLVGPAVLFVAGGVGLVTSLVLYIFQSRAVGSCAVTGDAILCDTNGEADQARGAHVLGVGGASALAGGSAALAASVVWFAATRLGSQTDARRARWRLTPVADERGVGLRLGGSF